jgi:hypothetical protein
VDSYFQSLNLKLCGAFIFLSIPFCLIKNFKMDLLGALSVSFV